MTNEALDRKTEKELLGTLVAHPSSFATIRELLPAAAFESDRHRAIYTGIKDLDAAGVEVTEATLARKLAGTLRPADVVELSLAAAVPAVVPHLAGLILQRWTRRNIRALFVDGMSKAREDGDPFELIIETQAALDSMLDHVSTAQNYRHISAVADDTVEMIGTAINARAGDGRYGVQTGFIDVDRRVGAYLPGEFVVVGARPAMGKTAYAMTLTQNAATAGARVGWFSLEMSAEQLVMRSIAAESGLPLSRVRVGDIDERAYRAATAAMDPLRRLPVWFDDEAGQTIQQLVGRARTMIRREGLDLIVVDYMGLIDNPAETHEREIAGISKALKRLAKSERVVVLALSQLSRQVEGRGDKRPQLSDLRYSGGIEQDADFVHFIYRPEYYDITTDEAGRPTENVAELITAKFRQGPTGIDRLYFDKERVRFADIAHLERYAELPPPAPF